MEKILAELRNLKLKFAELTEEADNIIHKVKLYQENIPMQLPVKMQIAENIVEELFINGNGDKAKRLVLELEDRSNGDGWGKKPMIDIIVKHLSNLSA